MNLHETKAEVFNRGTPPDAFLGEMVTWAKGAPDSIFARNNTIGSRDIYNKVFVDLGPYSDLTHRKAVMLEVMRVLAGFESSWDWTEGIDTSRAGSTSPENAEAGAWQLSYDCRRLSNVVRDLIRAKNIFDGIKFQRVTKFDHPFAMECVSTLMRYNTKHNGPLYRGEERNIIRKSLRDEKHSIFPWLRRAAVTEFVSLLSA